MSIGKCLNNNSTVSRKNVYTLWMIIILIFVEVWLLLKIKIKKNRCGICIVIAIFFNW